MQVYKSDISKFQKHKKELKNRRAEGFEIMGEVRRKKCASGKNFKFQNPRENRLVVAGENRQAIFVCLLLLATW